MIDYKVNNSFNTLPLSSVELLGSVGEQMNGYLQNRILSDFAKKKIFGEATRVFGERRDDETGLGYWRGEFWGKQAISAARTYKYTGDKALKQFLIANAHELLKFQDADGYLNTYADKDNVLAASYEIGNRVVGWDCDWNWNIWCRKYTLWGLVEIYEISGDREILDGVTKLCDHLIGQLNRLNLHIMQTGTFYGLPAGSILKPLLKLYEITENQKYFDFAENIVAHWERAEGRPNIITNALSGTPVHEWYPEPNTWAKAYEMMSCFDGLIEYYRLCGRQKYLDACIKFYDLLKESEYNVIHSVGFNDQFSHGGVRQNSLTEACDVIHWIRLASELYGITGDVKYIDDMEKAFYNPLLAASFTDEFRGARVVRSSGRNELTNQMDLKYHDCCTDNMPRGYLNVAENFVCLGKNEVYVNFYTDFKAKLPSNISISAAGSYLKDGRVKITVTAEHSVRLNLRIPDCSKSTSISLFGNEYRPEKSGYYPIDIEGGTTEIDIKFEWQPQIVDFKGEVIRFKETDFRYRRFVRVSAVHKFDDGCMVWERRSTLQYGPLLLTRSKKCGNTHGEMFNSEFSICGKGYSCTLIPTERRDGIREQFKAVFTNGEHTFSTDVCDFASGSNSFVGDSTDLFSIWF